MSWQFCDSGYLKTRKDHRCAYCGRTIPKGNKVFNWHGMFEGEFQNSYACHWCDEHQDELVDDDGCISDFWECIDSILDYPHEKYEEYDYSDFNGDYLVLYDSDDKKLERIYMPVIKEERLW
jgi:hypothetical protein